MERLEKMRKKLPKLSKLEEQLDDVFQMYIRYRDNFECITCHKKFPRGERQVFHAGHFISRRNHSTRWDEENVNGQCAGCNLKQSRGDAETWHKYEIALDWKYGRGTVTRLINKSHEIFKPSRPWLEMNIELYKRALKELEK